MFKKLISRSAVILFVLATLAPGLASAQLLVGRATTYANLGDCLPPLENRIAYVVDADAADDLGNGGGTVQVWARCISSAWEVDDVGAVADLAAYLPLVSEGATPDAFETTIGVVDPTADRSILFPDESGTLATTTNLADYAPLAGATFTGSIRSALVVERKVTNVTVADDAAGTKPAGVTPITTDFATCTCNDATGCTMSVAEPTPTAGYGRSLTIVSAGTGNCEYADSAGVTEIGAAVVLEPTSVLQLVYANAAWHRVATADNVP